MVKQYFPRHMRLWLGTFIVILALACYLFPRTETFKEFFGNDFRVVLYNLGTEPLSDVQILVIPPGRKYELGQLPPTQSKTITLPIDRETGVDFYFRDTRKVFHCAVLQGYVEVGYGGTLRVYVDARNKIKLSSTYPSPFLPGKAKELREIEVRP